MLRADRLLKLADVVEKMPAGKAGAGLAGFDMGVWHEVATVHVGTCDTVSCIGGTASMLFDQRAYDALSTDADTSGDFETLHSLFYPNDRPDAWHATPKQAARVIRNLVETGKVDWNAMYDEGVRD